MRLSLEASSAEAGQVRAEGGLVKRDSRSPSSSLEAKLHSLERLHTAVHLLTTSNSAEIAGLLLPLPAAQSRGRFSKAARCSMTPRNLCR